MMKRTRMLCALVVGIVLTGCGSKEPEMKSDPSGKSYAQKMIDNPSTPPAQKEALKKSLEKSGTAGSTTK